MACTQMAQAVVTVHTGPRTHNICTAAVRAHQPCAFRNCCIGSTCSEEREHLCLGFAGQGALCVMSQICVGDGCISTVWLHGLRYVRWLHQATRITTSETRPTPQRSASLPRNAHSQHTLAPLALKCLKFPTSASLERTAYTTLSSSSRICTCITNHFFSLTDTTASASAILLQHTQP